jgi:hypothetical protein
LNPEELCALVVPMPYNRVDGSMSWFDLVDFTQVHIDSNVEPRSLRGPSNFLQRIIDGTSREVAWVAYSQPLKPIDWDLVRNPPEWVVHAVSSRNASMPDFDPEIMIDRPECREWVPNPSHTLFKAADEVGRVDYIEVTLDQVLYWCRYHFVIPPEIVLKDLAERRKTSVDASLVPREIEEPDAVIVGTKARPSSRKAPRGKLDEFAVIELKKNPSLTDNQLAAMLECNPNTLRNPKKCPLLAAAKAMIKSERDRFRGGSSWQDRRPDNDDD